MLTLYYSAGSSSLAAHILLTEVAAEFETVAMPIAQNAQQSPEFLRLNPKGRLPALLTPDGLLSENPAILEYIAASHPAAGCLPQGVYAQAKAREVCAYLCATVHVAFAHAKRGQRWATSEAALADMHSVAPANLQDCAAYLEEHLAPGPWALGSDYSYCDPYLFLMDHWMRSLGLSLDPYRRLAAHRDAMRARPATQAAQAAQALHR